MRVQYSREPPLGLAATASRRRVHMGAKSARGVSCRWNVMMNAETHRLPLSEGEAGGGAQDDFSLGHVQKTRQPISLVTLCGVSADSGDHRTRIRPRNVQYRLCATSSTEATTWSALRGARGICRTLRRDSHSDHTPASARSTACGSRRTALHGRRSPSPPTWH